MTHPLVTHFEDRRRAAAIPARQVCIRAGVGQATLWRWIKGDTSPNVATVARLESALDDLMAERAG